MAERVTLKWTYVNWITVFLMVAIGWAIAGIIYAGVATVYGGGSLSSDAADAGAR